MLDKSFNPKEAEARIYKMWEDGDYFKPDTSREESFSIVIPPPNVTGNLHMGHAVNNTIQDILARYHRMKGKAVLWQPGMDHAGIATQMVVERKLAAEQRPRSSMSREDFVAEVWKWKEESGGNIVNQLKRLGSSCDWSREKFTLGDPDDSQMADAITKAFVDMYNEGLIYRDKRLVNWDPHFQTAISDLEVENIEVDGHFWHFKYPLEGGETYTYVEKDEDGNVTLTEERDYISIATTRPETMLGDGAVAVHPDDERYWPLHKNKKTYCYIPVGKKSARRKIPIITDEYPDPDFGSGAVKITGAHDFNDYEVAKRNDIPMYILMDGQGRMRDDHTNLDIAIDIIAGEGVPWSNLVPEKYRGMDRFKARKAIVADIDAEGLLIAIEDKKVMQPFGDRSKVVIEPMLTDQWFVDAEKLAGEAMAAVERGHSSKPAHPRESWDPEPQAPDSDALDPRFRGDERNVKGSTRFIPENWKKTYDHWMKEIQPWCISRQLWWGHRVPVWYGQPITTQRGQLKAQNAEPGHFKSLENDPEADELQLFPDDSKIDKNWNVRDGVISYCAQSEEEAIKLAEKYVAEKLNYLGLEGKKLEVIVDDHARDFEKLLEGGQLILQRDPDVLDTWFSSGLWPFSTLGWPDNTDELARFYPTSVLVTAFDIIFFWVARMMMQGLYFMDEVPFNDVYIHALVLDEAGKKMSKSIGNTLDPLDLIDGVSIDELVAKRTRGLKNPNKTPQVEKATRKAYPDGFEPYGADALRFTLASQAGQGRNIRLSVDRIAGYRNFGTKLWSAASFGQMNGCKPLPGFNPASPKLALNKWIISEAVKTVKEVTRCIETYRFNDAADAAYKFVWDTFCSWHLEMAKPVLSGEDGPKKNETRATFAWVFDQILKLLHPFMPFITEELWSKTSTGKRKAMLIVSAWPKLPDNLMNAEATKNIEWLQTLITNLRSVRADMNIPPSKKAPLLMIADKLDPRLAEYADVLSPMARVEVVETASEPPKGALQTVVDGVTYAIPMEGLIDLDAERARLSKEIEKTQSEIDKIDKKLGNKNFTDKAPADVVELQKDRRAAYAEELAKLQDALSSLG